MFGSDKRNGRTTTTITTLIAHGTVIRGDVEYTGGLHLDGVVEGSLIAQGEQAVLTVSEKGRVAGSIRAANACINGEVIGDIFVSGRLELAAQARIDGNVHYKVLEMTAGAQVNGKMVHESDVPRQLTGPAGSETAEAADA
ncbi:polymer-forming cytoskeletal protein [Dokdonella sp.]|uniref:bactofilin family protein n=1 Tax=Dokdonella sp. TaxID=2291710 RepID=UPI0025C4575D|nr:polymer-forming cytoskeletal protein [Dokdonella sp.]MBX3691755.1 polymer-forming cytoskeletal protein [Dokdonella sp.]MCW5569169.1 polymer-forming cytoskeletal protein [Dokdonella sp.]